MTTRKYDNAFREEQAEQTRSRLLDAVRDLLAEPTPAPITMAAVAAKAGVSEPTAYRHFASRDALLEGANERFSREAGAPPMATRAEDLPAVVIATAAFFGRNAVWMRAALRNPHTAEMRAKGRQTRNSQVRALLAAHVEHLAPRDREIATAMLLSLVRLETWDLLTREYGLTDDEVGRGLAWGVQAFLDALKRSEREDTSALIDEDTVERGQGWSAKPPNARRQPTPAPPKTGKKSDGQKTRRGR